MIGQATFITNATATPFPATSLSGPGGVAVSPVSGKLFIADYFNARITRYASAAALASGAALEDQIILPAGGGSWSICVDKNDSLRVADNGSGTIFRYDTASGVFSGITNHSLIAPGCEYLFVDARGTLWITYGLKSRTVTWLANATTFTSLAPVIPTWTGILKFTNKPELGGIAVATKGTKKTTLWVADAKNNKVYRFDNPKKNWSEKKAAAVLGQPKTTDKGAKSGASGLSYPRSLFLDSKGALWVADTANDKATKSAHRALRFDIAAKLKTGAKANAVIGQFSFTANQTGVTSTLLAPYRGGICVDAQKAVWFADDLNNRVLRFARVPKTK